MSGHLTLGAVILRKVTALPDLNVNCRLLFEGLAKHCEA